MTNAATRPKRSVDVANHADATLTLTSLGAGVRAARDAKAVAYLKATGNDDLLAVLGLVDETETTGNPSTVACPICKARPGSRCQKQFQHGENKRYHQARYRVAGREQS